MRTFFKWDMTPVVVERHERRKQRQQELEDAYRYVDERDGNRCWVTGTLLSPAAIDPAARREHHHLVPRSRSKALRAVAHNIILVSALAHELITKGWIAVEGDDARRPIFFHYTELAKSRPLIIKRRNMSQCTPQETE
jgi:hypothetical protein